MVMLVYNLNGFYLIKKNFTVNPSQGSVESGQYKECKKLTSLQT
ncbi:hypothetical protein pb186bvf_019892 [Paramecium bursaria]